MPVAPLHEEVLKLVDEVRFAGCAAPGVAPQQQQLRILAGGARAVGHVVPKRQITRHTLVLRGFVAG